MPIYFTLAGRNLNQWPYKEIKAILLNIMADCNQSSYVLVQKMSFNEKVLWTCCSKHNILADQSQYDIIIVSRMYIAFPRVLLKE